MRLVCQSDYTKEVVRKSQLTDCDNGSLYLIGEEL